MKKANLFCGKEAADESNSNHLVLAELKLPTMEEQYVDHRPGGGPITIEIDLMVNRLEATFSLVGWSPQVAELFNSWVADDNWFTAYGYVQDQITGEASQGIALFRGRLGRAEPVNWRPGDLQHWNYSIRSILHYELVLADESLYLYDFANNTFLVGGVDRMADINAQLQTGATNISPIIVSSA